MSLKPHARTSPISPANPAPMPHVVKSPESDSLSREQLLEENRMLRAQLDKEHFEHAEFLQQIRREANTELRELQQTIIHLREQMEAIDWDRKQALQKTASESRAEILQLHATIRELRAMLESGPAQAAPGISKT